MAVWHHDIEGPPHRSDYMDPEIVRGMIGRGFRLGLYGHQHKPQVTPQHVFIPGREEMAVVSAGSLCAGARELPTGARRGYSVIEIGDDYDQARVHVREMAFANLFSRANLAAFEGKSFVDLKWTRPVDAGGRPETPELDKLTSVILAAEASLNAGETPAAVLSVLQQEGAAALPYGRRLITMAGLAALAPDETLGVADFLLLQPTAGREALTTESLEFLNLFGAPLDRLISERLAERPEANNSQAFINWVAAHRTWALAGQLRARIEPGDSATLMSLGERSQTTPLLVYSGTDPATMSLASVERPLVQLARNSQRRMRAGIAS